MRIDAHQHYWDISRGDYGWITPDLPILYRDFTPSDLQPFLDEFRIDGTIAVQAAPTLEETRYLLSLAEHSPSILGVVGWLALFDPQHREHFEEFRRHPKYVGFRIMIQEMPNAEQILEPGFVDALRGYERDNVPVDLLVLSHQLEPLVKLLHMVPNLRGVIDHLAKPPIRAGIMEPWKGLMTEIASFPKIWCKLSGMVTEAEHRRWKSEDFITYVRTVTKMFGSERVMFGSDWPVCLLSGDYKQVIHILEEALPEQWREKERVLLFGENAKEFYRL